MPRLPNKRRRRHPSPSTSILPLALLALSSSSTTAQSTPSDARLPSLDFPTLGTVGLFGSFAALQLYDPSSSSNSSLSLDPSRATLLSRDPSTGSISPLAFASSTTAGAGTIDSLCVHPQNGRLYFGGRFESVNPLSSNASEAGVVRASNVASWDPQSRRFETLGTGVNGEVASVSCDAADGKVYVGGSFTSAGEGGAGYAGNVAVWDVGSSSWSPPPFAGLNGPVYSISSVPDHSSIFFGGAFSVSSNSSSATGAGNTTISSLPGSSIPSLGSSLVPISLNGSDWDAGPTTYTSGYGRPQYVFCPQGDDGIGNSWLLVDGTVGQFTTRFYRAVSARGLRVGNTFIDGRGTRTFRVTSIPDNTVLTLTYRTNPSDPNSPTQTCTDSCPLQHSSSIPYEDFIFPTRLLTGFQLTILTSYGAGGGLHLLQLLSPGSASYASPAASTGYTCTGGVGAQAAGSTATTSGTWTRAEIAVGDVPGTDEAVLVSSFAGDGSVTSSNSPSVTWTPYVASPGEYTVTLHTPGCDCDGSCERRTTVDVVTTLPGGATTTTTVDQRNKANGVVTVYQGQLSPGQGTTITLRLSSSAPRPAAGGQYSIYADRIELRANKTDVPQGSSGGTGYGVWEYVASGSGAFGDAQGFMGVTNATAAGGVANSTGVDRVGAGIRIPGAVATSGSTTSTPQQGAGVLTLLEVERPNGKVLFMGGNFTYSAAAAASTAAGTTTAAATNASTNVVVYAPSSSGTHVPTGGLNGVVTALAYAQDGNDEATLYLGGRFSGPTNGTGSYPGLVKWRWESSGAGWETIGSPASVSFLGGQIESLKVVNLRGRNVLLVAGGTGNGRGFASYDIEADSWTTDVAFVAGSLAAVGGNVTQAGDGSGERVFMAGNVRAAVGVGAPGTAYVDEADGEGEKGSGGAMVVPLRYDIVPEESEGVDLLRRRRRGLESEAKKSPGLVARALAELLASGHAREEEGKRRRVKRAPSPGPTSVPSIFGNLSTTTARILSGVFYTNSTGDGDDRHLTILGGQFDTTEGRSNLLAYDEDGNTTSSVLPGGAEVEGEVRALAIWEDRMWIGGRFSVTGGPAQAGGAATAQNGLTTVFLNNGTWDADQSSLVAYDGTNVTVNAISRRPVKSSSPSVIVIAGHFASAGSLPCPSVCLWDESQERWTSLGGGLAGVVTSIDFAGSDNEFLLVSGDLIYNSTRTFAARWSFDDSTWNSFGTLANGVPGPATAIKANDGNEQAVFVAGTVADTPGTPYLVRWDGTSWSDVGGTTLRPGSGVEQLVFVPITDRGKNSALNPPQAGNGQSASERLFDDDRMLLVSGALSLAGNGEGQAWNVSAALVDGQKSWTPYLVSLGTAGGAGAVAGWFFEKEGFKFGRKHFLSTALVILISAAISLGIVFFLALAGLLIALWHRPAQSQEYAVGPTKGNAGGVGEDGGGQRIEPDMSGHQATLLSAVQKLTEKGAFGGPAGKAG